MAHRIGRFEELRQGPRRALKRILDRIPTPEEKELAQAMAWEAVREGLRTLLKLDYPRPRPKKKED